MSVALYPPRHFNQPLMLGHGKMRIFMYKIATDVVDLAEALSRGASLVIFCDDRAVCFF
jgi:hypothetical protein